MKIYTFGDSHAVSGWKELYDILNDYLLLYGIGPRLCYSFGRDGLDLLNIREANVQNDDIVIFCFGEIDLRCNIQKYITKENTYDKIIDTMVEKYFVAIEKNVKQFEHLNICIYNVVPTVQKYNTFEYPNHPFMGTDEERKIYVKYFNSKCKEYCNKYGYTFFDVYHKYCDRNGYLNKEYSDDNVHIEKSIFIVYFLYNYLISLLNDVKNTSIYSDLNSIINRLNTVT
jgi:hypothetical protein